MKLISWNVNGLRACVEKGFLDFFKEGSYSYNDVVLLNGDHFLFGFLERIFQSEKYSNILNNYDGELQFIVELE